jgi:hypothetical protein
MNDLDWIAGCIISANDEMPHTASKARKQYADLTARLSEAERLLRYVLEVPYWVDEATVPNAGIAAAPNQVVTNFSFSWARREEIAAFLAAKP